MKLVILDRDGVINEDSDEYIKTPDEWIPIPGSLEAIAKLNNHGFKIVLATNQSGLARGLFTIDTLNSIHKKLQQQLSNAGGHIEFIVFCPHGPNDNCLCRKPRIGMLAQIKKRLNSPDLRKIPYIGDSMKDIIAANNIDARPFLVLTGKGMSTLKKHSKELSNVTVAKDLISATDYIVYR